MTVRHPGSPAQLRAIRLTLVVNSTVNHANLETREPLGRLLWDGLLMRKQLAILPHAREQLLQAQEPGHHGSDSRLRARVSSQRQDQADTAVPPGVSDPPDHSPFAVPLRRSAQCTKPHEAGRPGPLLPGLGWGTGEVCVGGLEGTGAAGSRVWSRDGLWGLS